ncbi:MAG: nucleotidyltransferase family protein [Pseudomonadota bacterium]
MTDRVLLLAAGSSSRMRGADKLLELVDHIPLLRRQVVMAQSLGWPVYVALPPRPHPRYAVLEDLGVELLSVKSATEGMGGTLRDSVKVLPEDTDAVLVLLADLPDITSEDLTRIAAARDAHPAAAIVRGATSAGAPGHPILFRAETLPAFGNLAGDDGGKTIIAEFADRVHLVPLPEDRARRDLDTPEDWQRWRAARQAQQ